MIYILICTFHIHWIPCLWSSEYDMFQGFEITRTLLVIPVQDDCIHNDWLVLISGCKYGLMKSFVVPRGSFNSSRSLSRVVGPLNHYPPEKKKLKLSDPVRKWPHLDLEHLLIHRPHFLAVSDECGLNPRLREHNNSFATLSTRVWRQKTVSIEWFGTEDRARELISEVSGGLYERK